VTRTATALLATLIVGGSLAALAIADPAPATFSGNAIAVDGDTLRVGGVKTRLFAIDAPEAAQTCKRAVAASAGFSGLSWPCGAHATAVLRAMLARDPWVTCEPKATDRYGRAVAACRNSEGDLGGRLVAQGLAVAYRRYSMAYVDHEEAAKAEKLGIWSGSFEMPEQWRKEHRR
jgi:endonuclease YncB( thermonuclease family)